MAEIIKMRRTENSSSTNNLVPILKLLEEANPQVIKTLEALMTICHDIRLLHKLKAEHRKGTGWITKTAFYDLGIPHCSQCGIWTESQISLRHARRALLHKLERESYGVDPIKLLEAYEEGRGK